LSQGDIETLLHYARFERYRAGYEIYAQGSPGQSMMAVLRGSVKMTGVSPQGQEIVFNTVKPGDLFGEISLLDGAERSSDAVVLTDCEILVLNRRDLLPILERRPDILMILIKILCQEVRQRSEQIETLLSRHLESRIAKALLQIAGVGGLRGVEGASMELHVSQGVLGDLAGGSRQSANKSTAVQLSQRALGNLAGGSRESVNKYLQDWHKAGLITLGKGMIEINDIRGLERLTNLDLF
jgi:CRP-like cAMP-binding protein